jgi:hypothetical protein
VDITKDVKVSPPPTTARAEQIVAAPKVEPAKPASIPMDKPAEKPVTVTVPTPAATVVAPPPVIPVVAATTPTDHGAVLPAIKVVQVGNAFKKFGITMEQLENYIMSPKEAWTELTRKQVLGIFTQIATQATEEARQTIINEIKNPPTV